ncbi:MULTISPECIES: ABC transporter substrate-binding protein [Paraburkholderia]|jgi:sulfonate transport system substrate-binding protein|uniref:Sulfonate transport system substrate-binding protein n=1 Tax=Paraburkholderia phenazinium TaxID=60549 RepID=A0A1N6HHJ1_9BURK|nr:ABC transporter substrate-binding protein [Paraburkholderia phenazinium]SIO19203.1 sulfonate transport system substrate-binding protein [Paraburkholderia phenazinium]
MYTLSASRRRLLKLGVALAAAPLTPRFAFASSAPANAEALAGVTLRVATYKGGWPPLLAASGLADTPYRIEWHELNNGLLHIEAINADALDIGSGSEIPAVFAARQNANVKFIARTREDLNNQATLARKDTPIQRIADLKGKRVGYVRATTSHYFLYRQLTEAGLSFDDIHAINLAPADGLPAFAGGDIDAWAIYGYNGQLARNRYGARELATGKGYLSGNFPIYANPRALDDARRRAAIGDLLVRLRHAYAWANPHFIDYARAQSAETRVPVDDLVAMFNRRSDDFGLLAVTPDVISGHQEVANVFAHIGVLDGPTNVAPFWDASFTPIIQSA